eukprot:359285-Chlamydomonas_euryale.AAC.8
MQRVEADEEAQSEAGMKGIGLAGVNESASIAPPGRLCMGGSCVAAEGVLLRSAPPGHASLARAVGDPMHRAWARANVMQLHLCTL